MKTLINNLILIFKNAVIAGRVHVNSVKKGIAPDPSLIGLGEYPFISFDDGGQSVEEIKSDQAQRRVYNVIIEIGINVMNVEMALDSILDIVDECKKELELEANRPLLYDSHVWAVNMTTLSWGSDKQFFRGVQIACKFYDLEIRMSDY